MKCIFPVHSWSNPIKNDEGKFNSYSATCPASKFLKNKEFSDEGKRWIISDVKYSQEYKKFMAIHRIVGEEDDDENNEMMPVDELLPLLDGDGGTPP